LARLIEGNVSTVKICVRLNVLSEMSGILKVLQVLF
jgi:hypothetical protein